MNKELYNTVIKYIATNPKLLEDLPTMPNIEFRTMGGKVFWTDIASYNGWRIQQNVILNNCRILNPDNVRVAWGGKEAMENAFKVITDKNYNH